MSSISVTNINDGDAVTAASVNNQVNTIVNDYNGNITAANLAAASVTSSKIASFDTSVSTISNPYKFSVYRNGALTVNTGSLTKVTFETENFDTNSNFDAVTNNNYTAPVAGFYWVSAVVSFSLQAGGTRMIMELFKNGSDFARLGDPASTNAAAGGCSGGILVSLAANDTIDIRVQPVGANTALAVGTAPQVTHFEGLLISRT